MWEITDVYHSSAITCSPLTITNGMVSPTCKDVGCAFGTDATYQCDGGFYLMGDAVTRTCGGTVANGTWSGQAPSCEGESPGGADVDRINRISV